MVGRAAGRPAPVERQVQQPVSGDEGVASLSMAPLELLRAVLWNMADGVTVMDRDNRIVLHNPAAARLLDLVPGRLSPAPGMEFRAADGALMPLSALPSVRALSGQALDDEVVAVRLAPDAPDRWFSVTARPLDGPDGIDGALLVFRDVTGARQADASRQALEARVRQAQRMEAIGQLAGGVAHDFNNLLQAITGFVDLARGDLPDPHPARRRLDEAARAAERASALTRQLLLFSRREPAECRVFDLCRTVTEMVQMIRRVIGPHIDLELHAAGGPCCVDGDPGQVEQVLLNLCVNARDALGDGGLIRIETTCDGGAPAGRPGRWGRLTVRDNGPGIPEDIRSRIFEPFFTTKPRGKGTGLGLATAWAIVEQHGGVVELETAPGAGAAFHVWLPAVAERETVPVARPQRAPRGHGETVLLVEDEELVRALALEVLERAGYRVLVARDGDEACALIDGHRGPLDAALIDVMMPKKNGRAVAAHLRRAVPGAAIVMTSGYDGEAAGSPPPGPHALLRKPYGPALLLIAIREALDHAASRPPASSPAH
ncbi:MAG: ATP-binding protein [Vicinamibacterales bacterium]